MRILAFDLADEGMRKKFHGLPQMVYANDPIWTPQSEEAASSLFALANQILVTPFLCLDGEQPLARAAAIMYPGTLDEKGRLLGFIGLFECLEHAQSAGLAVLQQAEQELEQRGAMIVQAPRVDNMNMGLVVEGSQFPQTVLTPHNPPYYVDLLKIRGYRVRERLYTYIFDRSCAIDLAVQLPGIHTRTFNRQRLQEEILLFHKLQKEIFKDSPGWVPRTLEQDRAMIDGFLPLLDDELIIIAEDNQGNPVGLLVCLPDVYQAYRGQPVDNARVISIGAIPRMTRKGVGVVMGLHLMHKLLSKNYQTLEASWVRDSNSAPKNLAKRFRAKPGRVFALFEKELLSNEKVY